MDIAAMIREARDRAGLTQAELARRTGTSQSALARYEAGGSLPGLPTLERLLRGCGRQLELSAGKLGGQAATSTSVRGQLGARAQQLRHERRRLLESAHAHGVRRVRVFGSVARGDAGPASDIDLLVELAPGRTLVDLAGFQRRARQILGTEVDVATADMLKEHVRAEVLAEALPL